MKNFLEEHEWKIIENKFRPEYNQISESIFSIGNGRMGQRANLAEGYSGKTLQGSYIGGIYYPDKTKVGWWKNGYPEYFAKVLNSVNWIGLDIKINGQELDLAKVEILDFHRILDMQNGLFQRYSKVKFPDKSIIEIESERFYSNVGKDQAFLNFKIRNTGKKVKLDISSFLDFNVKNKDSNFGESFWNTDHQSVNLEGYQIQSTTKKTGFSVLAAQHTQIHTKSQTLIPKKIQKTAFVGHTFETKLSKGEYLDLYKYTAICSSFYHSKKEIKKRCEKTLADSIKLGYEKSKKVHSAMWRENWENMDVVIDGDLAAQQAIRFNIFQLYQTYTGEDARLNIGPKGFTGEKYGGSTYWDTEAYCLPFYLSTAKPSVAKNLLKYRYDHLQKAIENAEKLGFKSGAALYPMVTMTGEECHNEWEITFEEIHRNGAIAYAIYDYIRYTGDEDYIAEYGLETLVAIARFWYQRTNWSDHKKKYVILGVTGPNEYENNVNNNWYTNYLARWCLNYAESCYLKLLEEQPKRLNVIGTRLNLSADEVAEWVVVADQIYLPESEETGIFLQQDGYLDKENLLAKDIPESEIPIHQNWSWDRILRSPFIKQADVLQGLYFFRDDFTEEVIEKNFNYYEPRTVHESSLSPCVHCILAAYLGKNEKAYEMYLRSSRLDLDNYNNDTEDGLHITSMAGSWMSVVKGFAGFYIQDGRPSFSPFLPTGWNFYSFRIVNKSGSLGISINKDNIEISNHSKKELEVLVYNKNYTILEKRKLTIPNAN